MACFFVLIFTITGNYTFNKIFSNISSSNGNANDLNVIIKTNPVKISPLINSEFHIQPSAYLI